MKRLSLFIARGVALATEPGSLLIRLVVESYCCLTFIPVLLPHLRNAFIDLLIEWHYERIDFLNSLKQKTGRYLT